VAADARRDLAEATVSFLGFGIAPPTLTWGNLLVSVQHCVFAAPWLAIAPVALIALVTDRSMSMRLPMRHGAQSPADGRVSITLRKKTAPFPVSRRRLNLDGVPASASTSRTFRELLKRRPNEAVNQSPAPNNAVAGVRRGEYSLVSLRRRVRRPSEYPRKYRSDGRKRHRIA
jgi:hypothetical protein